MNIYDMLKSGMTPNELRKSIDEAEARIKQEQEENTKKSQHLVDICNRALTHNITAEDVAYFEASYGAQKYPKYADVFTIMLNADSVDSTIDTAHSLLSQMEPLLHMFGAKDWNEVLNDIGIDRAKELAQAQAQTSMNDGDILREFLASL